MIAPIAGSATVNGVAGQIRVRTDSTPGSATGFPTSFADGFGDDGRQRLGDPARLGVVIITESVLLLGLVV